jgi:carbamoyl-phosphate synthase large subunit
MKSTGEVMGIDPNLGIAYAKSQMASQPPLPLGGNLFISVRDADKAAVADVAREYVRLGFQIFATAGTGGALEEAGVPVNRLFKVQEGRPNVLDMLINDQIAMVINTPSGKSARADEVRIRTTALYRNVPVMTTLAGARAAANGIAELKKNGYSVRPLQSYHHVA